jgi:NAD(P)-dependent dehydrogenase (short-subunit alcohol dehydrogenase family)
MKLAGRVAIVTGGGRGIGCAIALGFAAEGAAVTVSGTRPAPLEATRTEIEARGGRAHSVVADVSEEEAVARMIADTVARFGRLDILVNNAGIAGPTAPVAEAPTREWERTLAINLTGAFLCAKHAIPHLVASEAGRIINITSVAGKIGYALRSPYAASKWGMIGLTRSLALEVGPRGVTVNAIAPGSTRGERLTNVIRDRAAALGRPADEVEREFFLQQNALGRLVEPEEIAATAVFLASDEARNITGETISVSAGFRL